MGERKVDCIEIGNERIDVNMESVRGIVYHEAQFPGDCHYVTVYYNDGMISRYFNPDLVMWEM